MLLTGNHIESYIEGCADIIPWTILKAHLKQNTDEDRDLISIYASAAVSYCEQYCQRTFAAKSVTMYYHAPDGPVYSHMLQLIYYYDITTPGITIKVTDANGLETTITDYIKIKPDQIFVEESDLPTGWMFIGVTYTPQLYDNTEAILPAILMKVGEMYNSREDGPTFKNSSIISILNRHRIKRHP